MRRKNILSNLIHVLLLLLTGGVLSFVVACTPPAAYSGPNKRIIRTAEQLIALSRPSMAHKVLRKLEGNWTVAWRSYDLGDSVSGGFSQIRSVMDGRFVEERFQGVLAGKSFQGRNFIGYNNATDLYEGVWIDSLNTGMTITKGRFDEESDTIFFVGSVYNPVSGKTESARSKLVFVGEDSFSLFVKSQADSKRNRVSLELQYNRAQPEKKSGKDAVNAKK